MKQTVTRRVFGNSIPLYEEEENRTVYTRRDGSRYVKVMGQKLSIKEDTDGLFYEHHGRFVPLFNICNITKGGGLQ